MTDPLSAECRRAIELASHNGDGWALLPDEPAAVIDALEAAKLIRQWKGNWILTPTGFLHHPKGQPIRGTE